MMQLKRKMKMEMKIFFGSEQFWDKCRKSELPVVSFQGTTACVATRYERMPWNEVREKGKTTTRHQKSNLTRKTRAKPSPDLLKILRF